MTVARSTEELKRSDLSEHGRCPKCGMRTLERDPEGDIHCWTCGTTLFDTIHSNSQPVVNPSKMPSGMQQPTSDNGQKSCPRVEAIKLAPRAEPITRKGDRHLSRRSHPPLGTRNLACSEPQTQSVGSTATFHHPRGRLKGERVGHYGKTTSKVEDVIRLYNLGYSIRPIMQKLSLAGNTVKNIIQENSQLINHVVAKDLRQKRVKQQKQSIILALKGLASSAKSSNHSYEWMFESAGTILAAYMKRDPVGTVKSLVGDNVFTVDDVIKKAYEITLGQRLRLDDEFVEVEPGTFWLKGKQ